MKRYLLLLLSMLVFSAVMAQSYSERATAYVAKYKDWAIAEQLRSGVPAAITLAQGIHETNAGASELATNANNHFGIKCKSEWTGETYAYTDDAPNECFRKYKTALESYHDHSNYLHKGTRYAACFALDTRDYKGWAHALKRCGYATNKSYAHILIKLIEDYNLEAYTEEAFSRKSSETTSLVASAASPVAAAMMSESNAGSDAAADTPAHEAHEYGKLMKKDGVRGFWAHQGDVLLEYAIQFKVRYSKLLEMNSLPDAPLAKDQFIYIERGGSLERLMAKDPSSPMTPVASPAATTDTAPIVQTPVATEPVTSSASATPAEQKPAQILNPAQVTAASEDRIFAEKEQENTASAATTTEQTATNNAKPFNIANEKAVEELPAEPTANPNPASNSTTASTDKSSAAPHENAANKPAEPQDEFSRLKARLDKVVYAQPATESTAAQPVASPAAPTPAMPVYHTVRKGETAYGIARQYHISMQQLLDLNKFSFGSEIKVGQQLRVK